MSEEEQELLEQREHKRTSLTKEEEQAKDRGVEVKTDEQLKEESQLVQSMELTDDFEY